MTEKYNKINERSGEIEKIETKKQEITLDELNYQKASLIRNQIENTQVAVDANVVIDALITAIDARIIGFKALGIKTLEEAPIEIDVTK